MNKNCNSSTANSQLEFALHDIELDFLAIIFDMDGLVLDTESTYFIAWQKASAEMGYQLTKDFCLSLSGIDYQAVEQRLLDFCGNDFNLKEFNNLSAQHWYHLIKKQSIPIKKGFNNLLALINANNIPFCLATNSCRSNALECLEFSNLNDVFSIIVTNDDVKKGKPDPEMFFKAAELLKIPISQCLVLEDSMAGIQAANLSGACSVFIPSVFPVDHAIVDLADYCLDNLDDLGQILNKKYTHNV